MNKDLLPLLMVYLSDEDIKRMTEGSATLSNSILTVLKSDGYWLNRLEDEYSHYITVDMNIINCRLLYEILNIITKAHKPKTIVNIINAIDKIADYYSDIEITNLLEYCRVHKNIYIPDLTRAPPEVIILKLTTRPQVFQLIINILPLNSWLTSNGRDSTNTAIKHRRNLFLLYLFNFVNKSPVSKIQQHILDDLYVSVADDQNINLLKAFNDIEPVRNSMIPRIISRAILFDYSDIVELFLSYITDSIDKAEKYFHALEETITFSENKIAGNQELIINNPIKCLSLLLSMYPNIIIDLPKEDVLMPRHFFDLVIEYDNIIALEKLLVAFPSNQYPYEKTKIIAIIQHRSMYSANL
jgi:hypothetical protein